VAFGHNGHVAWGATTNHVDRQDLVVHRRRSEIRDGQRVEGYEVAGRFVPFEYRSEVFEVRDAAPVRIEVRFTQDGPLLNDLEPFLAGRIPLTALRRVPAAGARDLDAARDINRARTAREFAAGVSRVDLGCLSWLFADAHGSIGFRSPCRVPIRAGWRGAFPVPGWPGRYEWQGLYPKTELPASSDPARGWLATANGQIVPSSRFPSSYNNDASAPNRFLRIAERIHLESARGGLTAASSAAIQLDTRYQTWAALREQLEGGFCAAARAGAAHPVAQARRRLCAWDGAMEQDSVAATLWVLWTHALLDRALADELRGDAGREVWRYAQSLLQFEANVAWLWSRPEHAAVWDDVTTEAVETRSDILERALADAVAQGNERYGRERNGWAWGRVRPFVLRHPFAPNDGLLGSLLNRGPLPIGGGAETVFKQQFPRSDRARMRPAVGPIVRFTIDFAAPWQARYSLAGGESGWPRSPFYANLLEDWARGRGRPLTPDASEQDVRVRFVPAADS
jgi:acyl-homoserine lactone acylase PvdQ